ncbi:MAG: Ig-like domain-containing protein [Bacteroidaceae bacterium]|nr:Ig-like domain-containing protein [Bacteroidaceae bacterium]
MKRSLFAALLLMAGLQTVWAQKMTVRMANSQTYEFNVPEVASVTFDEDGPVTGRAYVDLGLPSGTLWATCNVGANTPEEYGDYFAWGETQPKNIYNWGVYQLCGGAQNTIKKYCTNSSHGTVDDLTALESEDDAATVNWGGEWQTPTQEQMQELLNRYFTTYEQTTQNGVTGMKVTSMINGNSIFLPAAGGYCTQDYYGANFYGGGTNGVYWSRSLFQNNNNCACYMFFSSDNVNVSSYTYRYFGLSVRPVRRQLLLVKSITLPPYLSLQLNEAKVLTPTVLPAEADNRAVVWESSDVSVAEVNGRGRVIAKGNGSCIVTCRAADGSGVYAECQVTVGGAPTHGTVHGHEWVDLMLPSQTLWATCNVGAYSPEKHGSYFAWGETAGKDDYSWGTYRYCEGSQTTMTKYCVNSNYGSGGFTDDKKLLEPADDAASVNWCECWQMPTNDQFYELVHSDNTTYEWTTENGVNGVRITSKRNGESIFLPASGSYSGTSNSTVGTQGHYWTRSLNSSKSYAASHYQFHSTMKPQGYSDWSRYTGLSVRPVLVPGSYDPSQLVTNIFIESELSLRPGEAKTLTAVVLPLEAENTAVTWESNNETVATVDGNGTVTGKSVGICTITCRATDGSGVSAECKVTVLRDDVEIDENEWVDLGLPSGTLWATCNVGANAPEEFGDYFAWGETTPKDKYTWDTYEYGNKASWVEDWRVFKYCTNADEGVVDNKTELEPMDDAATANMGSEWQTPSVEQQEELLDRRYTAIVDEMVNGVIGRKVISKANGKSIFLPCSGWIIGTVLDGADQEAACYWSRSVDPTKSLEAFILYLNAGLDGGAVTNRSVGCAVRAVRKK